MLKWTGVFMILYLTTGTSNLIMAFPTQNLEQQQGPKESQNSPNNDQALRLFQKIFAINSQRFMNDIVRSFVTPEDMKMNLEPVPTTHSTPTEESLEPPNILAKHTRPSRNADETNGATEDSRAGNEGKPSSPFPYLPSYPTTPGSTSTSSSSNSNPLYGGYNSGMPGSGHGDATLVIGGFNVLLVPMPGVSASNMGSILQNSQQLSQLSPGNPFATERAAV